MWTRPRRLVKGCTFCKGLNGKLLVVVEDLSPFSTSEFMQTTSTGT